MAKKIDGLEVALGWLLTILCVALACDFRDGQTWFFAILAAISAGMASGETADWLKSRR
jgi:hypothetical protein